MRWANILVNMSELRPDEPVIYQIRAHLFYLRPVVWRRFLVRREASMEHLHQVICCLFDIDTSIPYILRAAKVRYSVGFQEEEPEDMDIQDIDEHNGQEEIVDEKTIPIYSLIKLVKDRKSHSDRNIFLYYRTPDNTRLIQTDSEPFLVLGEHRTVNWTAVISCEKVLPVEAGREYPVCTEGERASPPRCFSGHNDYSAFLDNKKRLDKMSLIKGLKRYYGEDAAEFIALVENDFNPGIIDMNAINQCLGRITQC